MAKINTTREVFVMKIQALYDIESLLEKTLPKLEKAAKDPDLKEGFAMHLEETHAHVSRLLHIFEMIGEKPKKLSSEGIRGIIQDGSWVMKAKAPDSLSDLMLASSARYAEHFEMAGYMSAIELAKNLKLSEAEDLLIQTLGEEEMADDKLAESMRKSMDLRDTNMADEDIEDM